uniref:Isopentenyl-diphosphate Delta-isomerase n=1 Tax=Rhabditophanes sp. KR3021 TaxID=114890 RepID=A0AC35U1M1_9BILA
MFKLNPHAIKIPATKDICIQVSAEDKVVGPIGKVEAHMRPLTLHRAFSVFLFNSKAELLLQKRSAEKVTFPSVWSNTCCSHPLYNEKELKDEKFEGIKSAASRRMGQELGINDIPIEKFNLVGKYSYEAIMDEIWGEKELDYSLILKNYDDLNFDKINKEEISEIKFVSKGSLDKMIKDGQAFSPWFMMFYNKGFLQKWWDDIEAKKKTTHDYGTIYKLD